MSEYLYLWTEFNKDWYPKSSYNRMAWSSDLSSHHLFDHGGSDSSPSQDFVVCIVQKLLYVFKINKMDHTCQ